jgi:hypothetical protein
MLILLQNYFIWVVQNENVNFMAKHLELFATHLGREALIYNKVSILHIQF